MNEEKKTDQTKVPRKDNESEVLDDKRIYLVKCHENKKRRLIHQILESKYPTLPKTSLKVHSFWCDVLHRFAKCWECDYKRVPLKNYNY